MISYAEIQFDQPAWIQHVPPSRQDYIQEPQHTNTECNYLVMFFVVGVFAMAITDGMRKP